MTIRNLEAALKPASVAVFGASDRPGSPGAALMRNVSAGGFDGAIWPVNPKHRSVAGHECFRSAADLPGVPDVAVIATPPASIPGLIDALGRRGGRLALVVSPGVTAGDGLRQRMLDAARPHLLRIIGPNSAGLIAPSAKLNASLAPVGATAGNLALLSQSGAIASTMVDWAAERGVGFSHVVSLGDMADVDAGDYLDLLAGDWQTRAILLYLESVPEPRKFLSAARVAASLKPVIAVKAGRSDRAMQASATHTGMLSGADAVVDAALGRVGVLRVGGLAEMFAAAETVSRFRPLGRARLAIVTNSGGAGVLAVDRLLQGAGEVATLASATVLALDRQLSAEWSRSNPVDIGGDAMPAHYVAALEAVAEDAGVDAILAMHCPTWSAATSDAARAVAQRVEKGRIGGKPVLSCWLGGQSARAAREVLRAAGVASYDNPATAAAALGHLTAWGRAQAALRRVPEREIAAALTSTPRDAVGTVCAILARVAGEGRSVLTEPEAKAVLAAYGVPVTETRVAGSAGEAGEVARDMLRNGAGRLVLKLLSRSVTHKSDVGGVALDLETPEAVAEAARAMVARVSDAVAPEAVEGFTLQPMIRRPGAHELLAGIGLDPVFGPVVTFGAGGTAVEVIGDTAVALPPLDATLAGDLVARTRVGRLLAGYRDRPPADAAAIGSALVALSHLIEDFPCLRGVDVNPLLADAAGVVALDARMEIDPVEVGRAGPNPDMAIRPYPARWRTELALKDGVYRLRPIRPADALLYPEFSEHLDPDDVRMRFLASLRLSEEMSVRLTHLDYDREMAFVALTPDGALAGVARMSCDPDHQGAEYALMVRSDLQGRGIGGALMRQLIAYARADGVVRLEGMVLAENRGMQRLVRGLGFEVGAVPDGSGVVMSSLKL